MEKVVVKCDKMDCIYNHYNYCHTEEIHINDHLDCTTYRKRREYATPMYPKFSIPW